MNGPTFSRSAAPAPGVAVVVGGSSGIGRACALRLAADGHLVVVAGRRRGPADETVAAVTSAGGQATVLEMDVTDHDSVRTGFGWVVEQLGPVSTLVCSAGTNVVNRWWSELTAADFDRVVDTNLGSVARCVLEVLPGMREAGFGQVVVVSSWAGWQYMSVAAAAYSASKTGLSALVKTLNDQEGRSGIRTTLLCPGEVDTPILQTRPVPPPQEEIDRMLSPENVAEAVGWVTGLPAGVCVNELVLTPTWNRILLADSAYHPAGTR